MSRGVHEMEVERIVKALTYFPKNVVCQRAWNEWEASMLEERRQTMGERPPSSREGSVAPMSDYPMVSRPSSSANAEFLPMQEMSREEQE